MTEFRVVGEQILRRMTKLSKARYDENFRLVFGVTPQICEVIWGSIKAKAPKPGRRLHLLWALFFLKVYGTETVNRIVAGTNEKTFRKWSWTFIRLLADMKVIHWQNRKKGLGGRCFASVDGSDFRICEQYPFDSKWYSHKFHGPGLRYEVGLSILDGSIVWVNGPFPCGSFPDVRIFRKNMKKNLDDNEVVVVDGGYSDRKCRRLGNTAATNRLLACVRARHETVNRRMKQFHVLQNRFRHNLSLHSICFHAIPNITQLMLLNESPLFDIEIGTSIPI